MHASAIRLAAGLSAAAAALLLTACGGSDEDSTASSGSASSSSSAAATSSSPAATGSAAGAEAAAWCAQAASLEDSVNATIGQASSDPTLLAPALQQLADQYAGVPAPQAIAADWSTLVGGIQQLAAAAQGIDFTDPSAAEQLQASVGGLQGQLTTATTNVSAYAQANCPAAAPPS